MLYSATNSKLVYPEVKFSHPPSSTSDYNYQAFHHHCKTPRSPRTQPTASHSDYRITENFYNPTYKTYLPTIELAGTIWSSIISETNLQKLESTQNAALRIITGCNYMMPTLNICMMKQTPYHSPSPNRHA